MRQVRTFAHLALAAGIIIMMSSCGDDSDPVSTGDDRNTWVKTFGGPDLDQGMSILSTGDGIIVAGSYMNEFVEQDACLIKIDNHGNKVWESIFGFPGSDAEFAMSVVEAHDGGYVAAGYTYSAIGENPGDVYVAKVDESGVLVWERTFGGAQKDEGWCVMATEDDSYLIVGTTNSYGSGGSDIYAIKIDSEGDSLWTRTYGGRSYEYGRSAVMSENGKYVILGETSSYGHGASDIWCILVDPNGDLLEGHHTYGGTGRESANSIIKTSGGAFVIVGGTSSYSPHGQIFLFQTNRGLAQSWSNTFGTSTAGDWAPGVASAADGSGFLLAGATNISVSDTSGVYSRSKCYLIKTDGSGNKLWERVFLDGGEFHSVAAAQDGGFFLVGTIWGDDYPDGEILVVKTDANGNL